MKPQKYPVDNGESFDWMDRNDYLSINLGKWNKRYGDVFTKRKLMDMLDAVEAGMKIGSGEDEAVQSVWEQMEADVETARTYSPTVEVVETEVELDPEIPDNVIKGGELEVITGASENVNPGHALGNVLKRFDLGDELVCCIPRNGTTKAEIGEALRAVKNTHSWTEWAWGDLINYLEEVLGYQNVIPQVASFFHMESESQTLYRYARTAKMVPPDKRHQELHFSHFAEIACARYDKDEGKQKEKILELLDSARKEGWNVAQTRSKVGEAKGKSTKPTPLSAPVAPVRKHGRYIVLLPENCIMSYSCDELPENEEGAIIIDTLEGDISCSGCSAGVPVWQALAYRKLAPVAQVVEVEQ